MSVRFVGATFCEGRRFVNGRWDHVGDLLLVRACWAASSLADVVSCRTRKCFDVSWAALLQRFAPRVACPKHIELPIVESYRVSSVAAGNGSTRCRRSYTRCIQVRARRAGSGPRHARVSTPRCASATFAPRFTVAIKLTCARHMLCRSSALCNTMANKPYIKAVAVTNGAIESFSIFLLDPT